MSILFGKHYFTLLATSSDGSTPRIVDNTELLLLMEILVKLGKQAIKAGAEEGPPPPEGSPHEPPDLPQDVADFHVRFDQAYAGPPRSLSVTEEYFRRKFLEEKHREYEKACRMGERADELDALVGLVYVAVGTAYKKGWNFAEAWRRVHANNMEKIPAEPGSHKIKKPEDWTPPDHSDLVAMPRELEDLL